MVVLVKCQFCGKTKKVRGVGANFHCCSVRQGVEENKVTPENYVKPDKKPNQTLKTKEEAMAETGSSAISPDSHSAKEMGKTDENTSFESSSTTEQQAEGVAEEAQAVPSEAKSNEVESSEPKDSEPETLELEEAEEPHDEDDYEYQCGSCKTYFDKLKDDRYCPVCKEDYGGEE